MTLLLMGLRTRIHKGWLQSRKTTRRVSGRSAIDPGWFSLSCFPFCSHTRSFQHQSWQGHLAFLHRSYPHFTGQQGDREDNALELKPLTISGPEALHLLSKLPPEVFPAVWKPLAFILVWIPGVSSEVPWAHLAPSTPPSPWDSATPLQGPASMTPFGSPTLYWARPKPQ